MEKNLKNNKGFSLVELIIVIAILAILVGVVAVSLVKYVNKAQRSADLATAKTIEETFREEFYSNPDFQTACYEIAGGSSEDTTMIVACCDANSDKWVFSNSSHNGAVEEFFTETLPVPTVSYQKSINPEYDLQPDELAEHRVKYALGSWDEFTPKGWAVTIIDDKPVVFVTNGGGKNFSQGVSPLVCPAYR